MKDENVHGEYWNLVEEIKTLTSENERLNKDINTLNKMLRTNSGMGQGEINYYASLEEENADLKRRVEDYENRVIPAWKIEEDDWIERDKQLTALCGKLKEALERVADKSKWLYRFNIDALPGEVVLETETQRGIECFVYELRDMREKAKLALAEAERMKEEK